jgi:hypothetical protein
MNLYDAIFNSVKKSLQMLAVASGYKFDETFTNLEDLNNDETLIDRSIDFEIESDDRFKNMYLSNARSKSVISSISAPMDRPLSTVSALSRATWTNERKFDESYLK